MEMAETMADCAKQDIMVLLKRKQNHFEQIYSYTTDMEKSATQNDTDTIAILLDMRYQLMTEIEEIDELIEKIIQSVSTSDRIKIRSQMSESPVISEVSFEERKINDIFHSTKIIIGKIIESDNKLYQKIKALSKLSLIDSV